MPSANVAVAPSAAIAKATNPEAAEYITNPLKPALVVVEHKIRNLEKRKAKLDQYKSEQDAGKELNADQLTAVAKYNDVMQQLDLSRELVRQLNQANDETRKEIKKLRKAEVGDRAAKETEKLRMLFLFQLVINDLENCQLSQESGDNSDLNKAVLNIRKHEFMRHSQLNLHDPNFNEMLSLLATNWAQVLDGSKKAVDASAGKDRTTYKSIKDNLLAAANSDYFLNKRRKDSVVEEEESREDNSTTISDSESIPSSTMKTRIVSVEPPEEREESVFHSQPTEVGPPSPFQEASPFSFIQESTIDIESPQFDPAVVAVSSCLPPPGPINAPVDLQSRDLFSITTTSTSLITAAMSNGMGIGNTGGIMKLNDISLMDNSITQWNGNMTNGAHDNIHEDRNESGKGHNYGSNQRGRGFSRGGGFRRGQQNGPANSYGQGNSYRGSPHAGPRNPGGFPNSNRMGVFRSEQPNQDHSFGSREYRSNTRHVNPDGNGNGIAGNRGSRGAGGYRGGQRNGGPQGGGGNYNGKPSSAPRGNGPRTSENGLSTKCY